MSSDRILTPAAEGDQRRTSFGRAAEHYAIGRAQDPAEAWRASAL